jgi:hypothetical protein
MRMATTPLANMVSPPAEPTLSRSQWERIDLGEGLELQVRRPLTRPQQRKLEKLLDAARTILGEPEV